MPANVTIRRDYSYSVRTFVIEIDGKQVGLASTRTAAEAVALRAIERLAQ